MLVFANLPLGVSEAELYTALTQKHPKTPAPIGLRCMKGVNSQECGVCLVAYPSHHKAEEVRDGDRLYLLQNTLHSVVIAWRHELYLMAFSLTDDYFERVAEGKDSPELQKQIGLVCDEQETRSAANRHNPCLPASFPSRLRC